MPRLDGDFAVCATDGFLLVLFDAAVVRGAAFGFFGEATGAGDNWGWGDAIAEIALPSCVISSGLTGPAAGVGNAIAILRVRVSKPISRAITALSQRITRPQQT